MSKNFEDNSEYIKAALDSISSAAIDEIAGEIVRYAVHNCKMRRDPDSKEEGKELAKSYRYELNEEENVATIGSGRESAFWEEFGTGEYADTSKNGGRQGRQGWWIYTPGHDGPGGKSRTYNTREEAERMAAYIEEKYGKKAVVTNGREPNYTLEKAFISQKEQLKDLLTEHLQSQFGK